MKLQDVLAELNINTGGGAYVEGDVSAGGDFIGRDKVVNLFVFCTIKKLSALINAKAKAKVSNAARQCTRNGHPKWLLRNFRDRLGLN